MTDHRWTQEHVAAAVAGGLNTDEGERFDAHIQDCPECASALADARRLDRGLGTLFASVRPGPKLEDEVIHALRATRVRRLVLSGWKSKLAFGVAASVGLGITGAMVSQLAGMDTLPFPGSVSVARERKESTARAAAENNLKQLAMAVANPMTQEFISKLSSGSASTSGGESAGNGPGETDGKRADAWYDTSTGVAPTTQNYRYKAGQEAARQWGKEDVKERSGTVYMDDDAKSSNQQRTDLYAAVKDHDGEATHAVQDPTAALSKLSTYYVNPQSGSSVAFSADGSAKNGSVDFGWMYMKPTDHKPAVPKDAFTPEKFLAGLSPQQAGAPTSFGTLPYSNPQQPGDAEKASKKLVDQSPVPNPTPVQAMRGVPMAQRPDIVVQAPPQAPPPAVEPQPAAPRKIVIRSGDIEFEVESFDVAVATVTKLITAIPGGFVATVNSEKLPNGKVKGSMVVRVPPDHLDTLVLDLRKELGKAGELKGQRIGSQDISKMYTDMESRLKAARTMEQRLLKIIQEGKGEIKQLLEAEKELGIWRTKIEEIEGELRYYGNLVSLSTLTVTMAEREIKSAASLTEAERVQAGIEVEDVDAARQQALAAITEVKGRVTKAELKQLAAGQFNATLHFEVPPDAAGPIRDRLRQIGRVVRLEIDRVQQAVGGTVPKDAKVTRGDAQFLIQIYNLANVAPRETATVQVAAADVPAAYQAVRDAIGRANGRVLAAKLDERDRQNVSAQLDFEVRRADERTVQAALAAAGEIISRNVTRAPEGDNLTDAKVLIRTTLVSAARLRPRETTTVSVEVPDVEAAAAIAAGQVAAAGGRAVDGQVTHERGGRVTARLIYDLPLTAAPALVERVKASGVVRLHQSSRDLQAPDGRYATARVTLNLASADPIVAEGEGLWPQVRRGLSYSASVLLMSVTWVVFGLCVVLPWAIAGYAGYRVIRRLFGGRPAAAAATTTA